MINSGREWDWMDNLIKNEKEMSEQDKNLIVINLLATAQLFHEGLDELEGTPYCKQGLKRATKNMQIQLSKTLDQQIIHLWEIDGEVMQEVQAGIVEIMNIIATMDPAKITLLAESLKEY